MSSKSGDWETPQTFFDALDREFHFDLDACAKKENAKCKRYFSLPNDSALGPGAAWRSRVFMNPPYGREIWKWCAKAKEQVENGVALFVVGLLPARTDTKWFHEYCLGFEIRWLKGRLCFSDKGSAPFPSMLVIFRRKANNQ